MNFRINIFILTAFFSAVLMSCQNSDRSEADEVDIMSADEKNDSIVFEENEPGQDIMGGSTALQRFGDDPGLSSFNRSVMSSGVSEEFEGREGPFTFFAPSNAAYDALPAEQMSGLNDPKNSSENRELMKYYMVDGEMTVDWIIQKINASENKSYTITTMNGKKLQATLEDNKVILTDPSGNKAVVQKSEMDERFGVYHTIDNVLSPGGAGSPQVLTD